MDYSGCLVCSGRVFYAHDDVGHANHWITLLFFKCHASGTGCLVPSLPIAFCAMEKYEKPVFCDHRGGRLPGAVRENEPALSQVSDKFLT